jgi:hypothetical protein
MLRTISFRSLPSVYRAKFAFNHAKYAKLLLRSHASAMPDASSPTMMKSPTPPPKLFEVPILPFLGSVITMHSGHSSPNLEQPYLYPTSCREKYGDFYSLVSFHIVLQIQSLSSSRPPGFECKLTHVCSTTTFSFSWSRDCRDSGLASSLEFTT